MLLLFLLLILANLLDQFDAVWGDGNFDLSLFLDKVGLGKKVADRIDCFGVEACKHADVIPIDGIFDVRSLGCFIE